MNKPLRAVTCVVCEKKFRPKRRDAVYCSSTCRQRAKRARDSGRDFDSDIEQHRKRYWEAVRGKAEATGRSTSQIMTAESQFIDEAGNVYMGGKFPMGGVGKGRVLVGRVEPVPGWSQWGLEAAGRPYMPPPTDSQKKK